jgi:hypothetical protein
VSKAVRAARQEKTYALDVRDWAEVMRTFTFFLALENKSDRRQVRRLIAALEREALEVFRIGWRLERPMLIPRNFEQLRTHFGRFAIMDRLDETFARRHTRLTPLPGLKRVGTTQKDWYRHGGGILDLVDDLGSRIKDYEARLARTPRQPTGRTRSVAWNYLVQMQRETQIDDELVARTLMRWGYPDLAETEENLILLQDRIKKHRLRRGVMRGKRRSKQK